MVYSEMFPVLTNEWADDFMSKCPVNSKYLWKWEDSLKKNGYISKGRFVRDMYRLPFLCL